MKFLKLFLLTAVVAPTTLLLSKLDLSDVASLAAAAKEKIKSMPLAEKIARLTEEEPAVGEAVGGLVEKAKSSPVVQELAKEALESAKSLPLVKKIADITGSMSIPEALEVLKVKAEQGKPTVAEAYTAVISPEKKAAILREAVGLIAEGKTETGFSEQRQKALQAVATLAEDLKKSGKGGLELEADLHQIISTIKDTLHK